MSKVYFTNMKTEPEMGLLQKTGLLLRKVRLNEIVQKDKFIAVKVHFGEYGNVAFIRHNYTKVIVDMIRELGGKPYVTDANTLYHGSRSNAIDHIETAIVNGFTYETLGAPVIIADGLRGSDQVEVDIEGEYIKKAKVSSGIALADAVVVLSHFKGHELTGFGGAIKNIGMGSAARAGKMEQHSDSKPRVNEDNCVACRMCERHCPTEAITVDEVARIDYDVCIGCGECITMCSYDAMHPTWDSSGEIASKKMAEYAKAALSGKKAIFVSLINNVSPNCDCYFINEPPVAPDIGIVASRDPVSIDKACIDMVINRVGYDPFKKVHPNVTWQTQLEHAEKIGLGKRDYELVEVATLKK
ncbi:MAG: DUF362 domain-containing protein [Petrotogales bacterium]